MKDLIASLYAVCLSSLLWAPILVPQARADLIINPFVFAAGGSGASIALTETDTSNKSNASSTLTWTGKDFGAEAADRVIVCVFHTRVAASTVPSGATIGGQTATMLTVQDDVSGSTYFGCYVFWASVPTGTTGSVEVTGNATAFTDEVLSVYRMTGCSATAQDTGTAHSSSTLNDTLTTTSGGIVLAAGTNSATGGSNATWSGGVTEQVEGNFGTDDTYTSAFGDATGSSLTPQVAFGSGTTSCAAFVAFEPN